MRLRMKKPLSFILTMYFVPTFVTALQCVPPRREFSSAGLILQISFLSSSWSTFRTAGGVICTFIASLIVSASLHRQSFKVLSHGS